MPFVSDTFSGTNGTSLQSRTGEIGATWTKRTDTGSYDWAVNGGSAYYGGPATYGIRYVASGAPASAEYDVEAVLECLSVVNSYPGICGRFQSGADTNYQVVYNGGTWSLYKVVAGANTLLGSYASSFTSGTRTVKLEIRNATKRVYFDGSSSPAISSTDNAITGAGAVGVTDYLSASRTPTTGYRIQSIVANDVGGGATTSSADSGSFTITGANATTLYNRISQAEATSYTLTGFNAVSLHGKVSTADSGIFVISGADAVGTYTPAGAYTSIASPGSFAITGVAATGVYVPLNHYISNGAPGTFTITGSDTTISRTYIVTASPGSFSITGVAATGVYRSNDVIYTASGFSPVAAARTRDAILKVKTRTPGKRIKI